MPVVWLSELFIANNGYGFMFVTEVTGTSLAVFVLVDDRKSRSTTPSFLMSLAISDLLLPGNNFFCECVDITAGPPPKLIFCSEWLLLQMELHYVHYSSSSCGQTGSCG